MLPAVSTKPISALFHFSVVSRRQGIDRNLSGHLREKTKTSRRRLGLFSTRPVRQALMALSSPPKFMSF